MSEMKEKTLLKLERKFLALPMHHIDTDVLIESLKETKLGDICSEYLNKVGYKYRGVISLSVLGEFLLIIIRDNETIEQKEIALRALDRLIEKRKVSFSTPTIETFNIAKDIFNLDSRIEPADALHYATSIKDNANTFVTFDGKMERNKTLENAFGVKIIHPGNL